MPPHFDPREYVQTLDDGRHYLELKWRLIWLRSEHPEAVIETQIVPNGDGLMICRAMIRLADGATATGHGSADMTGDERAIEQAEDRALERALSALGYGTEFDGTAAETEVSAGSPPPVSLVTARELMDQSYDTGPEETPPAPQKSAPEEPSTAEDFSWTKFWEWAKGRGYVNARQLQELLGIDDIRAHTPLEVRRLIKHYELQHPPSDNQP